jgi:hypothetical protein
MYNMARDLLDALQATPEVLEALLAGYTQEQAPATRGGEEGWPIVEVVCHLRDAEERALTRMRLMRDTTDPVIAAYDQERWARERHYAGASLREALAAFNRFRAHHVTELAQLSPPYLLKTCGTYLGTPSLRKNERSAFVRAPGKAGILSSAWLLRPM